MSEEAFDMKGSKKGQTRRDQAGTKRKKRAADDLVGCSRPYCGPNIPMSVIEDYALRVAERFHPDRIILFGSFANGRPHTDSDVDLLVIMSAKNQIDQAVQIRWAVDAPFPTDL